MAITQTGSITTVSGNGVYNGASGTISGITVPADAEIMFIGVSAYSGTAAILSGAGTFDIGGNNSVGVASAATNWRSALHYILAPATGTQNLDWQWGGGAGSALEDSVVIISRGFWKGIDTGSPVRDSDSQGGNGDSHTTPTLTAQTGDLIIAFGGSFDAPEANLSFTYSGSGGAATLQDVTSASYADGAWGTASPTGDQTITWTATGADEGGIAAWVLKAAAAGAVSGQARLGQRFFMRGTRH